MGKKNTTLIVFFAIFLNMTGFAIILPLSPALIDYYLPTDGSGSSFLQGFVNLTEDFAASIGNDSPAFTTSVFFGCLLASLYAFLQFIFAPIWGRLSDKIGRKPILLFTISGTAVSYLLWLFSDTFSLFLTSRILAGIMAGNLSVLTACIADVTTRETRTKGMALVGAAFSLGFLIGPAIGGILAQVNPQNYLGALNHLGINPFSMPALVSFILIVINLILVITNLRETYSPEKRSIRRPKFNEIKSQPKPIFNTNLAYFVYILAFSGLEFSLSFIVADKLEYTPKQIGFLFLYIGFILILTQGYLVRKLTSCIEERVIAVTGIILGAAAFVLMAKATTTFNFYFASTFLSLSIGCIAPSLSGLVSLFASEETQGYCLGFFRSAGSLARAIGPTLMAVPFFYVGSTLTFMYTSAVMLLPLILIIMLPKPNKTAKMIEDPIESEEAPTL